MEEISFEHISHRLRELRIARGLTQEYIANKLDINPSHISNIENNRVKVSLTTLVNMRNILDTTVDYVLSDSYNDTESPLNQEILKELSNCDNEKKEKILKIIRIL